MPGQRPGNGGPGFGLAPAQGGGQRAVQVAGQVGHNVPKTSHHWSSQQVNETTWCPNGPMPSPNGATPGPNGSSLGPNGATSGPNGATPGPNGSISGPNVATKGLAQGLAKSMTAERMQARHAGLLQTCPGPCTQLIPRQAARCLSRQCRGIWHLMCTRHWGRWPVEEKKAEAGCPRSKHTELSPNQVAKVPAGGPGGCKARTNHLLGRGTPSSHWLLMSSWAPSAWAPVPRYGMLLKISSGPAN